MCSGELEYTINRIDDLYQQRVHLDRLTRSIRNSVLSVAFLETGLSRDHAEDEVIIDLNKMTASKQVRHTTEQLTHLEAECKD